MKYPILAIETTGLLASVALKTEQNGKIFSEGLEEKLNHLKGLLPLTDKVLEKAGLDINDVKTIAVSQGPGSFTGIRIGVSTVRAIAQITGAEIIGVPTQETFVYNAPMYRGVVCPVFDARMEQMYAGAFELKNDVIETLIRTDAYNPADYFSLLAKLIDRRTGKYGKPLDFKFFGDGLGVFEADIIHWGGRMRKDYFTNFSFDFENISRTQLATSVLKWAENFGKTMDYSRLLPVYIRKAEAQRRLDEKNACK